MGVKSVVVEDVVYNTPVTGASVEEIVCFIEHNTFSSINKGIVWDLSNFEPDISTRDIILYSKRIIHASKIRKNHKTAVVVKDLLNYGLVRALQNITEGMLEVELMVFNELNEALHWLHDSTQNQ